jgi:hypothetical protein
MKTITMSSLIEKWKQDADEIERRAKPEELARCTWLANRLRGHALDLERLMNLARP